MRTSRMGQPRGPRRRGGGTAPNLSTTQEVEMQTKKVPTPVKQTEKETPRSLFEDGESLALLILILAALVLVMATGLLLVMPKP